MPNRRSADHCAFDPGLGSDVVDVLAEQQ